MSSFARARTDWRPCSSGSVCSSSRRTRRRTSSFRDPHVGAKRACSEFTAPALGLGAHVGALGLRFLEADNVAADARGDALVARHGSHPPQRVGYDVMRIKFDGAKPRMEPFLQGFLQGRKYWGRPVDVMGLPDGSVLVSDDLNGAIYRVARSGG